jgi:hypothetical protein
MGCGTAGGVTGEETGGDGSAASLVNAGVAPYSTAAVNATMSQEWSTLLRMGEPT